MSAFRSEAERLQEIVRRLGSAYPDAQPGLRYSTPWELLVATVLSAQCTDRQVNLVTPGLFARYPDPRALSRASPEEIEPVIRSIGLFRTKARNLVGLAKAVAEEHGGAVPGRREDLERLPGVGRKTASVVLAQGFGVPAFAVDTHVARVVWRLGFTEVREPMAAEKAITRLLEPGAWGRAHLLLIRHGRSVCTARSPRCDACTLRELCPWPERGAERSEA